MQVGMPSNITKVGAEKSKGVAATTREPVLMSAPLQVNYLVLMGSLTSHGRATGNRAYRKVGQVGMHAIGTRTGKNKLIS